MTSGIDPAANYDTISAAADEAQRGGAEMLFTPEMSLLLDRNRSRAAKHIVPLEASSYVAALSGLAKAKRLWLALGSLAVALPDGLWANRSLLFRPDGTLATYYDKMHMFDVDLSSGETWNESRAFQPGSRAVAADHTPVGLLGLTICYDVRFPALFDVLGQQRCDAIAVPASFTVPTGRAHWHVLLRARAIEASAFVIAAAQVGRHADGRQTFGHSLVVDPWGEVLLDMGGRDPGVGFADLDLQRVAEVRRQVPSLANRRVVATLAS